MHTPEETVFHQDLWRALLKFLIQQNVVHMGCVCMQEMTQADIPVLILELLYLKNVLEVLYFSKYGNQDMPALLVKL